MGLLWVRGGGGRPAAPPPRRRIVRPAVVTITGVPGGATYASILGKAKEKVSLRGLGIAEPRMRRAMNGAIVIEVPGPQGRELASTLGAKLGEALGDEARVRVPVATGELRLRGIDPSTSRKEIASILAAACGCKEVDLRVSPITIMRDGMGAVWINCPLDTAAGLAELGRVTIGWTSIRIVLLKRRPVQCYRCWRFGHVRDGCKSDKDRTGACFRCGMSGHSAAKCGPGPPTCVICLEDNKEYRHRLGSARCLENQGFPSGAQTIGGARRESRPLRKVDTLGSVYD